MDTVEQELFCPICLDDFEEDNRTYIHRGSGHTHPFHAACIMGWAYKTTPNVTCPVCRLPLGNGYEIQKECIDKYGPSVGREYQIAFQPQWRGSTRRAGILVVGIVTTYGLFTLPTIRVITSLLVVTFSITVFCETVTDQVLRFVRGRGGRRKSRKLKRGGNNYIKGEIDFGSSNPFNEFNEKIDKINKDYAGKKKYCYIFFENIDLETSKKLLEILNIHEPIHVSKI